MNVLSIQSHVAYGHVGNSAAVFALQRLGIEVWPVHTVAYSNHPAHGDWRGRAAEPEALSEVLRGIEDRGAFARCDAVITGYLASAEIGRVALEAVDWVRSEKPDALYLCDPVMGDDGRFFVEPELRALIRDRAVPAADIVTPNAFELAYLCDGPVRTPEEAVAAADGLRALGPRVAAATGIRQADRVTTAAIGDGGAWAVETPWIETQAWGAGDAFAALFLGAYLEDRDVAGALGFAVSAIHAILDRTAKEDSDEMLLVAAQDAIRAPKRLFRPEKIR